MLPNVAMRFCTTQLKVNPVAWWVRRDLKWSHHQNVLGIRHDEPKRWGKALMEECHAQYPMVLANVTLEDVTEFWSRQPFDFGH